MEDVINALCPKMSIIIKAIALYICVQLIFWLDLIEPSEQLARYP